MNEARIPHPREHRGNDKWTSDVAMPWPAEYFETRLLSRSSLGSLEGIPEIPDSVSGYGWDHIGMGARRRRTAPTR